MIVITLLILICCFVGIAYKRLAESYKKSASPYLILGLVVFIIGYFLGVYLVNQAIYLSDYYFWDFNPVVLEIWRVLIGSLSSVLVYFLLRITLKNKVSETDILDQ